MFPRLLHAFLVSSALLAAAPRETVKDREGAVRKDRANMEGDVRWIYNDFEAGLRLAKETGKPLMVVMRCVPCLSCAGIDAQVLDEKELLPLLEQFVCVRIINANAIDLSLFQFDYDLSFSAIFMNGDRTLYGRFGSWAHQVDPLNKTTAGFRAALSGALDIHRDYPANRSRLAGKQGGPIPFKTPLEIPGLSGRYKAELDWEGKLVQSCVHCHQVGDAIRTAYRDDGNRVPEEWVYPFPKPETIGVTLATDAAARVEAVASGSIAAKAGMEAGDEWMSINGQPLISPADVSWALHRFPESGSIAMEGQRNGAPFTIALYLPKGWRQHADISRRAGTWVMRGMALGGMFLEELTEEERTSLGFAQNQMALRAKGVGKFGKHAAAKNAGFEKGDILTEVGGASDRTTEGMLIGHLLRSHKAGEKVDITVMRDSRKLKLALPIQ